MQPTPNPSESTLSSPLLIKPFERVSFVAFFTGMTFLCNRIVSALDWLIPANRGIPQELLINLLSGALLGFCQWLVLRKYIPVWRWIQVTSMVSAVVYLVRLAQSFIISEGQGFTAALIDWSSKIPFLIILYLPLSLGVVLGIGYFQKLILKPYVIDHWWWTFVPMICVLTGALFFAPYYVLMFYQIQNPFLNTIVNWSLSVYLTIPMVTQALAFCLLRKRHSNEVDLQEASISLIPEIKNYRHVQRLKNQLYNQISKQWRTDLEPAIGPLSYLVAVNHDGEIKLCTALNPGAHTHIHETPLAEIANQIESDSTALGNTGPVAKFNVMFKSPATLQVSSRQAISMKILIVGAYLVTILTSIILLKYIYFLPEVMKHKNKLKEKA
jgi:hypothetical protein